MSEIEQENINSQSVAEKNVEKANGLTVAGETAAYWLNALVDSAGDAIVSKTLDGVVTSWNPGAERIFGYTAEEMVGKPILILIPPDLQSEEREILARIRSGERVERYETVRRKKDGALINVSLTVSPIKTSDGQIIGASKIAADITKLKQAEILRRESENQLRLISDALPVLISYVDRDERYRFVNRGYKEWFGTEPEQMAGKKVRDVIGENAYAAVKPRIDRVLSGEEFSFEQLMPYPISDRFIRVNYIPDRDAETGAIKGFIALVQDISESNRAEAKLRESEARLRLALEISQISTFEIDLLTDKVETDDSGREIYGWAKDEPLTFSQVQTHFHPEDRERVVQAVEAALAPDGAGEFEVEQRIVRTNGETRWIRVRGRAFFEGEGEEKRPVRMLGTYIDITGRKSEELDRQFLLELGEKIRYGNLNSAGLLDEVAKTVCQHLAASRCLFIEIKEADDKGVIRHEYFKPAMQPVAGEYRISDYSPETLQEIKSGHIIVNNDAERDPRTAEIYHKTYEPYGEKSYLSIPLFTDGHWTAIFWISDDKAKNWTEREIALASTVGERAWLAAEKLRNDAALAQSRERLQMAMEAAKIYSWEMNLATRQISWSDNLEKVIGFALPPDYDATLNDLVHPQDSEPTNQKIFEAINNRENFQAEFRLINPYNGETIWLRGEGVVAENAAEGEASFVGITQNITERKKAEQEREELLRREQAARLQAEEASRLKDEFLATVSHELRTPLNAILGWSQMLSAGKLGENETARAVQTIYRNARSQAQLIEDILDVSRIITGKLRIEPRPIALAPVIQAAVESLRPALEAKHIRLQMRLDFERQMVNADADRLQQVVWNLLSNAIKFTTDGGQIAVELETTGAKTKIIVADTGQGIEPEFLPFVFDRFRQADGSSTRSHGGLGLGLSIVRHIVELHGGTVTAASPGANAGTTFTVALPLAETEPKRAEKTEMDGNLKTEAIQIDDGGQIAGLRILLVDDEPDTLELLASFLNKNRAETKTASSVAAALETLKNWLPDVIVSDIAMPEEDGYSFIKKLRALPPESGGAIPAIALTAYVGIKERTKVLASGFQMYVPKPVEPSELLGALANFARERK